MTYKSWLRSPRRRPIRIIILLALLVIIVVSVGWLNEINNINHLVNNYVKQNPIANLSSTPTYSIENLSNSNCNQGVSMNFVAHQDDDLLFMNPDVLHDIKAGKCVRTVYFTAGDDGRNMSYWLARQRGVEAAYSLMLGTSDTTWQERLVKFPSSQLATVASLGGSRIYLLFLHLPDGGLTGQGFTHTDRQSLSKLQSGQIPIIKTVDGSSTYTSNQLSQLLTNLMTIFQPNKVRALSSRPSDKTKDHSDHISVARFVAPAFNLYNSNLTTTNRAEIVYYLGYPIRGLPANLSKSDITAKAQAFVAYGKFDNASCHQITACYTQAIYGSYLRRQYTSPY